MGKKVKLLKDVTQLGVTVPKDTVGSIVCYPDRDGTLASQPDIENNTLKIAFLHPVTVTIGLPLDADQLANFIEDVPIETAVTPA